MTFHSPPEGSARVQRGLGGHERVLVGRGDVVGVVLFGLGGPASPEDIERYVYELLMDQRRVRYGWLPSVVRRRVARALARRRVSLLTASLQAVGGAAPELRLLSDQARALEAELKRTTTADYGLTFHVYAASRYGTRDPQGVIRRMREDGVTRVVLVPTAPVPLSAVTDTCVAAWHEAAREAEFEHVDTAVVRSHAGTPEFVQALSDRLDEALQRFPRAVRDDVHIIFALHPAAALDAPDGTPEQTPLAPLVDTLRHQRVEQRPCHYAYVQNWGLSRQPSPVLMEVISQVTASGGTGVVVMPIGFTTDTMETSYELDVVLRGRSEALGLQQYEIAAALNCNALYLQTLTQVVGAHLHLGDVPGDGVLVPLPIAPTPAPARGA